MEKDVLCQLFVHGCVVLSVLALCYLSHNSCHSSCSSILSLSLPLSLLCLSSLRALRWAPCSPAAGGASHWAGPAGVCPSGCGQGHIPPPGPLSLPPSPPQELSDVWSRAPWIPPRSASVDPSHFLLPPLPPSSPFQPVLGRVGRCYCQLSFASALVQCFISFTACFLVCAFILVLFCPTCFFFLFSCLPKGATLNLKAVKNFFLLYTESHRESALNVMYCKSVGVV